MPKVLRALQIKLFDFAIYRLRPAAEMRGDVVNLLRVVVQNEEFDVLFRPLETVVLHFEPPRYKLNTTPMTAAIRHAYVAKARIRQKCGAKTSRHRMMIAACMLLLRRMVFRRLDEDSDGEKDDDADDCEDVHLWYS